MEKTRNYKTQQAWRHGSLDLLLQEGRLHLFTNDTHELNFSVGVDGVKFHVGGPAHLLRALLSLTYEVPPRTLADVATSPAAFLAPLPAVSARKVRKGCASTCQQERKATVKIARTKTADELKAIGKEIASCWSRVSHEG